MTPKRAITTTGTDTSRARQLSALRSRGLAKAPIIPPARPAGAVRADLSVGGAGGTEVTSRPSAGRTAPRPVRPPESIVGRRPDPRPMDLVEEFEIPVPGEWSELRISSNDRLDKFEKAKRTKAWREEAGRVASREWLFPKPHPFARLVVWYRFPDNTRREVANLQPTSKAIVDGLVDAGVLVDDRDEFADGPDNRREYPNGPYRVTVQVWTPADPS